MIPKRGAIALFLTIAGLALLLSFKTPETQATTSLTVIQTAAPASSAADALAAANPTAGSTGASTTTAAATQATTSGPSGTYTGTAVQTRYGTVQVQITVASGKISDVQILEYPSTDPHSSQVSQYALPTLVSETLQAQSAQISSVSGATFTSQGYVSSLQSAIDQVAA
jgi:uncharacterized protein with FMN-binding domain